MSTIIYYCNISYNTYNEPTFNYIHICKFKNYLRIVATVSPPFQTYLENGCNSSKCFKGVYADTFHKLQEAMNFTFTIEWVKSFGGIKNGKWTGMIGILNTFVVINLFSDIK